MRTQRHSLGTGSWICHQSCIRILETKNGLLVRTVGQEVNGIPGRVDTSNRSRTLGPASILESTITCLMVVHVSVLPCLENDEL
jgi:hypothetical protein